MNELVSKRLGKYQILEEIGRGGFAAVYRSLDIKLDRIVALKVLAPHLVWDKGFVARFKREAKTVASLKHPSIVAIHEVGEADGKHYIAMDYLEGRTLKQLIDEEGPLPLDRVTRIVEQLASALDYAHEQGVVHRDIKPSNIIVGEDDHVTLTDFGIVKATDGTTLTKTGMLMGTPQYMSPEQCQGREVDRRSDVYSLGIVLYEMLTSRVPFTADNTPSILYMHVHETVASPRSLNPALPQRLEPVLARTLAKKAEERYATAGEMAQDLQRVLTTRATIEEPPTLVAPKPPTAVRLARRSFSLLPLMILMGALLAVLTLAGAAVLVSRPASVRVALSASTSTTMLAAVSEQARSTPALQPVGASAVEGTPTGTPKPTATYTATPTTEPSSTPTPTPTPVPPTPTPEPPDIVIDGLGGDWAGDSLAGGGTDLRAVYLAQHSNFVYMMVRTQDNLMRGQATVELNLDLRPGNVCGHRHELHTNIGSEDTLSVWEDNPCGTLDPYPIHGATVSWWDVLEVKIPRAELGEHTFLRPVFVCFWTWFEGEWSHVDCVPQ